MSHPAATVTSMPKRAGRRYYLTPPVMAYPNGRVVVHSPAEGVCFVATHDGRWDTLPGRDRPARGWTRVSAKDARSRLSEDTDPVPSAADPDATGG